MSNDLNLTEQLAIDAEFRKEFINNPKPFLAKLGIIYPAGTSVTVTETSGRDISFPIPAVASDELAEQQLEAVAGGRGPQLC